MTKPLTLFFGFISLLASANTDTLNQLNGKGKKNSYWIQYLDSMAYPTDSASAYFCGYDLYDNGKDVFRFSTRNKSWTQYKFVYEGQLPVKGKPVPINGTFKWYWEGKLYNEEVYKNGLPFYWNAYHYTKQDPDSSFFNEVLYFDRHYNNIRGTFYYEEWSMGKVDKKYWFRKGRSGWKSYRIKDN